MILKASILALMLAQSVAFAKPTDKAPVPSASKGDGKEHVATCNSGKEYWSSSTEHRGACSGEGGVKSWADGSPVRSKARKGEYR